MRGLGAWGVVAALLLGGSSALAAPEGEGDGDPKPAAASWWGRWFGGAKPPEKSKPRVRDNEAGDTPARPAQPAKPDRPPTVVEEAARLRAREEAKYMRRCEVCDRLKEVAEQNNDTALQRRAEEMEARAWDVYQKRTAHLPASQALFQSDEQTIQKHVPVLELSPNSAVFTVPGNVERVAAREDKR